MKVIEIRKDNRTGETIENSWGNNISSDFSIIKSVVSIVEALREQEAGKAEAIHNPVLDRFTTIGIRIELSDDEDEEYEDTTLEDALDPLYDTDPMGHNSDSYIEYLNRY